MPPIYGYIEMYIYTVRHGMIKLDILVSRYTNSTT